VNGMEERTFMVNFRVMEDISILSAIKDRYEEKDDEKIDNIKKQ
jgi:hypothetical protein